MAKKSTAPTNGEPAESMAGYFRNIFDAKPKLLKERSNAKILDQWKADHPGNDEVPLSVKNSLSNIKSILRSKKRRRKKAADEAADAPIPAPMPKPKRSLLESLEEQIDDCLTLARMLDKESLHEVIHDLRRARNEVVWLMGE